MIRMLKMIKYMIEVGKLVSKFKFEVFVVLLECGFVYQLIDFEVFDKWLYEGFVIVYVGFDVMVVSLYVGYLMLLMILCWLQKFGNCLIVVFGGGISQVGDFSFCKDVCLFLEEWQIVVNMVIICCLVEWFVDMKGLDGVFLVDNVDWLMEFCFLEFLCDYGFQFMVNWMMIFDSVWFWLEVQMLLMVFEFCYMMLQVVDFFELFRCYDCVLQIGGFDQWGNIVNGVEFGCCDGCKLYGMIVLFLIMVSGVKMGKIVVGVVWLYFEYLLFFGFWQFWWNMVDVDVGRFLWLFIELLIWEVEWLSVFQGVELNEVKKIFVIQVIIIVYGLEEVFVVLWQGDVLFVGEGEVCDLIYKMFLVVFVEGFGLLELIVMVGFVGFNGEVWWLVEGGVVWLNFMVVDDLCCCIVFGDLVVNDCFNLLVGKWCKVLVMFE